MKKAFAALAVCSAIGTAQAGVLINEGFGDIGSLEDKGWVLNNASTPGGETPGWYQGDQSQFNAHRGAPESYLAANYGNSAPGGILNNWLITPEFSTVFGATVSFWLRGAAADGFSDQVAFGFSNGSTNLASFVLEPVFTVPTGEWTRYVAHIGKSDGVARFALQYTGSADFANYIGFDSLVINEVPEPSTVLVLAAGALGLAAARRRQRP